MNRHLVIGAVLSLSAAAGVATGALIHAAQSPQQSTVSGPTGPGASTSAPRPSPSSTTSTTHTTTTAPTTTAPTTTAPAAFSESLLLRGADYRTVGLASPKVLGTYTGPGRGLISQCQLGQPASMDGYERMRRRDVGSGTVIAHQYVVEFATEAAATKAEKSFALWRLCQPEDYTAPVGWTRDTSSSHEVELAGGRVGTWWQMTTSGPGGEGSETYALVRSGRRVAITTVTDTTVALPSSEDVVALVVRQADVLG